MPKDKQSVSRVDPSLYLPFKEEGLRLSKEYKKSLKNKSDWSIEGLIEYKLQHGSPEFLKHLEWARSQKAS